VVATVCSVWNRVDVDLGPFADCSCSRAGTPPAPQSLCCRLRFTRTWRRLKGRPIRSAKIFLVRRSPSYYLRTGKTPLTWRQWAAARVSRSVPHETNAERAGTDDADFPIPNPLLPLCPEQSVPESWRRTLKTRHIALNSNSLVATSESRSKAQEPRLGKFGFGWFSSFSRRTDRNRPCLAASLPRCLPRPRRITHTRCHPSIHPSIHPLTHPPSTLPSNPPHIPTLLFLPPLNAPLEDAWHESPPPTLPFLTA
jgi:hypothetical protein